MNNEEQNVVVEEQPTVEEQPIVVEEQPIVVEEQKPVVTPENNNSNNKGTGGYKAVIVLLLLIILGGVGYFCYDKGIIFNKKDNSETKEENKKENNKERKLTEEEKEKFKERIETITNTFDMSFPIEDVTKISNQELLSFASSMLMTDSNMNGRPAKFSSEEVEKVITKYLGSNFKVTHENIVCSLDNVPFYDYDSTSKQYVFHENHPGHGGNGGVQGYYYFVDGKVTNENKIVINSHIIYGIYKGDTWGPQNSYYKSAKESQNGEPIIGKRDSDENIELTDDLYNSVKDKLPTTTYTFEKDKDGYYNLVSIQVK